MFSSVNQYLAKDPLRIKRIQNKFLVYVAHIAKIDHPRHDYWL